MISLLNDFLSLDKLDSGFVSLNRVEFDMNKLLDECLEEVAGLKKPDQEIRIYNDVEHLVCDPFLLKSVFINLISNGLKYSGDNGIVNVHVMLKNGELHIRISDNGIGIPASELQNLFTRFFRVSNAQEIKGTGLGLHIVARHVAMLKGEISYSSQEGKGTEFSIVLSRQNIS